MNLKMRTGKKGSYLVEAAISLPVFITAVIVLSSVILMYACIEDCSFIAAQEMRRCAAEAAIADTSVVMPYRIKKAIKEGHSQIDSVRLTDSGFRTERWGSDELLIAGFRLRLKTGNPLGIKAAADYDLSFVTRAYVGRIRDDNAMSAEEFADDDSEAVYIFPSRGERYHSKGCTFLRAAYTSGVLTSSLKRKYRSCPLCRSSRADTGSLVCYFPSDGESYHLPGCSSLQRHYIETEKSTAIERGYTPCSKCGG